jgi:phenylalanyl-tRNA synthetase beta chain
VTLEDPLSSDQSQLRTNLLGSLRTIAAHNLARGAVALGIFEVGTVFVADPDPDAGGTGVAEHTALGVLMTGPAVAPTWRAPDPPAADLFAVKGVLEALGGALRVELSCEPADPDSHPFLHPARAAVVVCAGTPVGWLGELHPLLDGADGGHPTAAIAAMELDLDAVVDVAGGREHRYRELVPFPPLRRDLAVVLDAGVPAAAVTSRIAGAGAPLIEDVRVFDVYTGPQVGEGLRSLALTLTFRAPDRTLSDDDVEPAWTKIVAAVGELGGQLRG